MMLIIAVGPLKRTQINIGFFNFIKSRYLQTYSHLGRSSKQNVDKTANETRIKTILQHKFSRIKYLFDLLH